MCITQLGTEKHAAPEITTPPFSSLRSHHHDVLLLMCVVDKEGCCVLGRQSSSKLGDLGDMVRQH